MWHNAALQLSRCDLADNFDFGSNGDEADAQSSKFRQVVA